jgi:hypothetical protein
MGKESSHSGLLEQKVPQELTFPNGTLTGYFGIIGGPPPEPLNQITTRRDNFPKNLEKHKILEIHAPNKIATEGADWRQHRKLPAPCFNKRTPLVFDQSCQQAWGMLRQQYVEVSTDGYPAFDIAYYQQDRVRSEATGAG